MKNLIAALTLFTRLPLWRWIKIPTCSFGQVVPYWSLCGWLTGGVMAGVFFFSHLLFSTTDLPIILALLSRLLLTGALHEDGLADFFDGFGGGRDKERILAIMKDSHIGTYGVLALIAYFFLGYTSLLSILHPMMLTILLLVADPFCKWVVSHLILLLPYARKEEESKVKVIYQKMSKKQILLSAIGGLLPLLLLPKGMLPAIIFPILLFAFLYQYIKKRIQGYTGDCMGAFYCMCEVSFWLGANISVGIFYNFIYIYK